jgi:hypothetical protein
VRPLRVRVHGTFVEDTVTRVAYWWNTYLGGYNINVRAGSVALMVDGILTQLGLIAENEGRPVTVDAIDLAGHGYPGGWRIGLDLTDPQQPLQSPAFVRWSRLIELKPWWSPETEGLTLRMCHTAEGERGRLFLVALAQTIGAKVRGWTGCYEIRPTGYEYTATPAGRVTRSGNTGRHWQILYDHQAKSRPRRILTAPVEGLQWVGRMMDLW